MTEPFVFSDEIYLYHIWEDCLMCVMKVKLCAHQDNENWCSICRLYESVGLVPISTVIHQELWKSHKRLIAHKDKPVSNFDKSFSVLLLIFSLMIQSGELVSCMMHHGFALSIFWSKLNWAFLCLLSFCINEESDFSVPEN